MTDSLARSRWSDAALSWSLWSFGLSLSIWVVLIFTFVLAAIMAPQPDDVIRWFALGMLLLLCLGAAVLSVVLAIMSLLKGRSGRLYAILALIISAPPLLFLTGDLIATAIKHLS